MERKVTSIKLDPQILKEAKKRAIDEGLTLSEYMELAIKNQMKK